MGDSPRAIYGTTFACACGRSHVIEPSALIFEEGALARLPEQAAGVTAGRRALVLFDARTREVGGAEAAEALRAGGFAVEESLLPDPTPGHDPVCDDVTHDRLLPAARGAELLVPVGSGVLSDLGKWLAFDLEVPCLTVATAASMNGYTAANVAPRIAGLKSLVRARPPRVVLAQPRVIADAPARMTVSGLGDVLAKSVSSADWRLNHLLFGDHYCARSVSLVADLEPLYFEHPERIRARDEEAIAAMFDALMLTGVAMTMAGSSAPASGGEHLVSHGLDMLSSIDGRPHDLHGRQVGVGTVLAAELYQRVLAVESPQLRPVSPDVDRSLWGPLADAVARESTAKLGRLRDAAARLAEPGTWDHVREQLAPLLRPPARIQTCLERAGGAVSAHDIGCERDRLLGAFAHGHEIRSRFTVLDLARLVGIMPGAAREIVEQWA